MSSKRILIVDDEAGFTRMLKLNLEQTGRFEVVVVNSPEDALAAARAFKPGLVLLDVFMPRMSGGDVAALLQAEPELSGVPIVFITAAVQESRVKEHGGVIGGVPFVAKPATLESILAVIEKHWPG
jgi:CheY-like chemotaxis protein